MEPLTNLVEFFASYGYAAVLGVLVVCGLGVPIPEDITLVAGGVISGLGHTDLRIMMAVGLLGVLLGDGIMFLLGRTLGQKLFGLPLFAKILTPQRFRYVSNLFVTRGNWVLFAARFMPGLRAPIYLTAGLTRRVSLFRFLAADGIAALVSVPVWTYLGYYGAGKMDWLSEWVSRGESGVLILMGILVAAVVGGVVVKRKLKTLAKAHPPSIAQEDGDV